MHTNRNHASITSLENFHEQYNQILFTFKNTQITAHNHAAQNLKNFINNACEFIGRQEDEKEKNNLLLKINKLIIKILNHNLLTINYEHLAPTSKSDFAQALYQYAQLELDTNPEFINGLKNTDSEQLESGSLNIDQDIEQVSLSTQIRIRQHFTLVSLHHAAASDNQDAQSTLERALIQKEQFGRFKEQLFKRVNASEALRTEIESRIEGNPELHEGLWQRTLQNVVSEVVEELISATSETPRVPQIADVVSEEVVVDSISETSENHEIQTEVHSNIVASELRANEQWRLSWVNKLIAIVYPSPDTTGRNIQVNEQLLTSYNVLTKFQYPDFSYQEKKFFVHKIIKECNADAALLDKVLYVENQFTSHLTDIDKTNATLNENSQWLNTVYAGVFNIMSNIRQGNNGRFTSASRCSDKLVQLRLILCTLPNEFEVTDEIKQEIIQNIYDVCKQKRHSFNIFSQPHSVSEFKETFKDLPEAQELLNPAASEELDDRASVS